jgi:two-component system response regulator HydG
VLYLVADVASAARDVGGVGLAVALAAVTLSLAPLWVRGDAPGAARVRALGVAAGLALVRHVAPEALAFAAEVVDGLAWATVAALALDLALDVPDRPRALEKTWLRVTARSIAAVTGLVALLAALPANESDAMLLPPSVALLPKVAAWLAVLAAIALRGARLRLGSGPDALAANAWAQLGLVPTALLGGVALVAIATGALAADAPAVRILAALACLTLVLGHARLVDARAHADAGPATRRATSAALTLATLGGGVALVHAHLPRTPLALGLGAVATLLLALGVHRLLEPLVRRTLAPARGALLDAITEALDAILGATTLDELARGTLGPLREAAGTRECEPLLVTVAPRRIARIDAAGEPHVEPRGLPDALFTRLVERPGEVLGRAHLEARSVRRPDEKPLRDALGVLDALAIVPLATSGELDGALVVPRGARKRGISLEEQHALERLGAALSARVAVLARAARADERAAEARIAREREEERTAALDEELARLRTDLRVLKAGPAAERLVAAPVAYSAAMRALLARVDEVAPLDAPVLLVGEPGTGLEAVAGVVHARSARARGPLVVADCGALRPERSEAALFGEERTEDGAHPGWLRLAAGGTLFLGDVPALSREAQRALADALAARQARAIDGGSAWPVDARVVVTSQRPLAELVAADAIDPELAQWLTPLALEVPPLRARREDLPSLVLLALDRATRTQGRAPVGIDQDALDALLIHDFPGNLRELTSVIERAVRITRGPKVLRDDLPPLGASTRDEHPLHGSYEAVERRLLEHALLRAAGNKSEAARLLALKRTTFLDKLRRYKLDDGVRDTEPPPAFDEPKSS